MGFKNMNRTFTFADIALSPSMEKNRAIKRMEEINAIVDWTPIEALLERTYPVGKSTEGNRAYPPILHWKPRSMIGSPSRGRISKKTLRRVNSELLNQFSARGCTITEGVAVENFFKTLKTEEVYLWEYRTLEDVQNRFPFFIQEVYNRKRPHSSLGCRPPVEFEEPFLTNNPCTTLLTEIA